MDLCGGHPSNVRLLSGDLYVTVFGGRTRKIGTLLGTGMSFDEAMKNASQSELFIFCYEGDGTCSLKDILREHNNAKTVSVVIGSEGGFSLKEVETARNLGAKVAGLGKRILRCETAPTFALSCIAYETEL